MLSAEPEIAGARDGILWNRRRCISTLLIRYSQQRIDLARIEPRQAEIEVLGIQILKLKREQRFVPVRPSHRAINHQPKGFHLLRRPFIAEKNGDFIDAELACGFQTQVTINDLAVAASQHRDLETKLA